MKLSRRFRGLASMALWGLAFLLLGGCEPAGPSSGKVGRVGKPAGTAPGFHFLWLDEAQAKAGAENKLVMLDFSTEWCVYCKKLDADTWPDSTVQTWLKNNVVAIKLDGDQEQHLVKRYDIRGYPTIVFLKPDGSVAGKIVGYRPPERFLQDAEEIRGKPTS
jgi:thiol-disulfide isomerase/thioredoxin